MSTFAAVVLAGGSARRMGGVAKPLLPVGGRTMLRTALAAVAGAAVRVVVGPGELAAGLPAGVRLTREVPPGGGPVAAAAAGLALVPEDIELVAVIAADQPFLTAAAIDRLLSAVGPSAAEERMDCALYIDDQGRQQRGCAAWRADALRRRLADIGPLAGVAMGYVSGGQRVAEVTGHDARRPPPWFDCDTEDDLRRAERLVRTSVELGNVRRSQTSGRSRANAGEVADERPGGRMATLDEWTAQVCAALDLDPGSIDQTLVLDLARDVAHGVARPAAPLTAYLLGLAVGRGAQPGDAAARIADLVRARANTATDAPT